MPPRTRISEAPQRISTRDPLHQRRTNSEFDPLHHRPITERSPRLLGDRRSPRGSQSDPPNQRKLGTRITDLESQLVQAQRELKNLKHQLASAEAENDESQGELHKKNRNNPSTTKRVERQGKHTPLSIGIVKTRDAAREQCPQEEVPEETHKETDVFEVPMEKVSVGPIAELQGGSHDDEELSSKVPSVGGLEKPSFDQPDLNNTEIEQLKAKLDASCHENEILKKQLHEVTLEISATQIKEEETALKNTQLEKDLEASNAAKTDLKKNLEAVELAKEELEAEMKKLRVQTEQWRKAADAAAAILAGGGGMEVNGGRVSERSGSMEKHFNSVFEPPLIGGYPGYLGSPGADDKLDDGFESGKRKGIRMFGDLWRKKGQK